MLKSFALLAFSVFAFSATVAAQPDIAAEPTYGTIALETGFTPDPAAIDLVAGGPDAVEIEGCNGYINNLAPDVDFDFETDGDLPLKIFVRSSTDTVILVNLPDGEWVCNDDYDGTSAAVEFETPQSGLYNIWVGTYSEEEGMDATLYFTELPEVEVDEFADASQSEIALSSGFSPDPTELSVVPGGIDLNPFSDCAGFINAAQPDVTLDFETDGGLPLYVYATEETGDDLTLMVIAPDGEYYCNDDASGLDPGLSFEEPEAGRYSIWVGSFTSRGRAEEPGNATLYISELSGLGEDYDEYEDPMDEYDPDAYSGGEALSLFATPTYGSVHLAPGFLPDPKTVEVELGGSDAVSVDGPGCAGFVNNDAPSVNLIYESGGSMLALYVESGTDGTLVVSMPNGDWICNDDDEGVNPGVYISDPEEGLYNIWVGSFSQNEAGATGTLYISESPR